MSSSGALASESNTLPLKCGQSSGLVMLVGGLATGGVGLVVGGLVGGGAGTAATGLTGNRDIQIPAESLMNFKLADGLVVQPE